MDERLMPNATFRCDTCGEQTTVTLTLFERRAGKADKCEPWPHHHGHKMDLVQVDYIGRS